MLLRPQQVWGFGSDLANLQTTESDDFCAGGVASTAAALIPSGSTFGNLNWRSFAANGGTVTLVNTDADAVTHGCVELAGTAANGQAGFTRSPSGLATLRILGAGQRFRVRMRVRNIPALSTAGERFVLSFGWLNSVSGAQTDAAVLQYSHDINGGQWRGVALKGGVATNVDSAIAVAINTPYWLGWDWDSANLKFLVNGVSIGSTAAANVPVAGVSEGGSLIRTAGGGATTRVVRVDAYAHDLQWGNGR